MKPARLSQLCAGYVISLNHRDISVPSHTKREKYKNTSAWYSQTDYLRSNCQAQRNRPKRSFTTLKDVSTALQIVEWWLRRPTSSAELRHHCCWSSCHHNSADHESNDDQHQPTIATNYYSRWLPRMPCKYCLEIIIINHALKLSFFVDISNWKKLAMEKNQLLKRIEI